MVKPTFTRWPRKSHWLINRRILGLLILVGAGILWFVVGRQENRQPSEVAVQNPQAQSEGESNPVGDTQTPASPVPTESSQNQLSLSLENPFLDTASADEILRLVNEYRKGKGLPEIVKNDRFCEWAYHRAEVISKNWSQEVYRTKRDDIFRAVCAKCKQMGEVLARNVKTPQETVDQWLAAKLKALDYPYNIGCVGGFTTDGASAYIAFELGERSD
jgi:hypothetical protein